VIVSILALINGIFSEILVESLVLRSVWDLDMMDDFLGTSRTSSKVRPSLISKFAVVICWRVLL
jgi:hypothetical protein